MGKEIILFFLNLRKTGWIIKNAKCCMLNHAIGGQDVK